MLVIGSRPEHFSAAWVKNEWSRYLALMAKDRNRLLIPRYRDMDPYDLPDEHSALQSQDMGKIGFMQDLLRGISKVLEAEVPEAYMGKFLAGKEQPTIESWAQQCYAAQEKSIHSRKLTAEQTQVETAHIEQMVQCCAMANYLSAEDILAL